MTASEIRARTAVPPRPRSREPFFDRGARPRFLAGTLAVALLLFGSRWAGYIGVQPIFGTDVLIVLAVAGLVLRGLRRPDTLAIRQPVGGTPIFLMLAFAFAVVRFIGGGDHSITAIRDGLPYFYIALGLLAMFAMRRADTGTRRNTLRLFMVALVLHAIWFGVQQAVPSLPFALPTLNAVQGIHIFTPRPDVDTSLTGLLGAMLLWRMLHGGRHPVWLGLAYVACIGSVAASFTRAGLLGTLLGSGFVILATLSERNRDFGRKLLIVAVIPLVLVAGVIGISFTAVGTKLIATVDPSASSGNQVATGAEGTTRARANAWARLIDWTEADGGRSAIGVGFGPDFLEQSGASSLLVGDALEDDVRPRSPHNYWLGTMARLGFIGLSLIIAAVAAFVVRAWRSRRDIALDPLDLFVCLVPLSLLIPASLGVVLESPFAAVPFWWCLGAAVSLPIGRDRIRQNVG